MTGRAGAQASGKGGVGLFHSDRERVGEGKRVELGGRRIIKKKKKSKVRTPKPRNKISTNDSLSSSLMLQTPVPRRHDRMHDGRIAAQIPHIGLAAGITISRV